MPNSPVADQEYITPAEATKIAYLSTKQLTRLADEGRIQCIRPGSHRRYLRADVLALLSKPTPVVPTSPEVAGAAGVFFVPKDAA